jgi:2-iminobutanoate/2-iminopropanoate deaminase
MLYGRLKPDATRTVFRLFCGVVLAAAVAGCAGTPKKGGFPWWPQGSGSASQDMLSTANAEPSGTSQASGLPSAHADESPQATTRAVAAPSASPPPAPAGHTDAVRYGDLLFVSGQIADDPASLAIVGSDIRTQVRTAMDNVARILESHGMAMSNVLSVTLYIQDLDELPKADAVYASYFRRSLPARSVVRVDGLPKGSLVEISVIAGR